MDDIVLVGNELLKQRHVYLPQAQINCEWKPEMLMFFLSHFHGLCGVGCQKTAGRKKHLFTPISSELWIKTWNVDVFPVPFSGDAQCSGTSRTVCRARWPPSSGRAALCRCTARTTPTSCSTCAALSAASCPSAAPRTRSSRTGTECGICRMRYVPVVWEFVAFRNCNVPVMWEFLASRDCNVPVMWEFLASRDCNVPVMWEFLASRDCNVPVVWEFVASRDCNVPVVWGFVASRDCSVRRVQGWKTRKRKGGGVAGKCWFSFSSWKRTQPCILRPQPCILRIGIASKVWEGEGGILLTVFGNHGPSPAMNWVFFMNWVFETNVFLCCVGDFFYVLISMNSSFETNVFLCFSGDKRANRSVFPARGRRVHESLPQPCASDPHGLRFNNLHQGL